MCLGRREASRREFVSWGRTSGWSCRDRFEVEKELGIGGVGNREWEIVGRGPRWSRDDGDGGMGGLKFAGGNLGVDQGPASCACDRAASWALCWHYLDYLT